MLNPSATGSLGVFRPPRKEKDVPRLRHLTAVPIALFHIVFILIIEAVMFILTLAVGLASGKMIVHNMYAISGKAGVISGPVRAFKEVLWGGLMMTTIVLMAVVPFEKRVLIPLREAMYKKVGIVPDLILCTLNAYVMGSCFAEASVLFEVRYCKDNFDFHWLNGPVRAFIYFIQEYKGGFLYAAHVPEGLEEVMIFPLFLAFSYPLYIFIRTYMVEKSSAFSVMGFLDTIIPKPCCCEPEKADEYKVDWRAQTCGLLLETGQLMSLYIPITFLTQVTYVYAGDSRPGFMFIGFGIFGFVYGLALTLMESKFPRTFKRARNGVESRVLINLCILVFFVTKNFLVYFENVTEETCWGGQMQMKSQVSRSFALYFTVSIYAALKIIFLCVSYFNGERNAAKAAENFVASSKAFQKKNEIEMLPQFHPNSGQATTFKISNSKASRPKCDCSENCCPMDKMSTELQEKSPEV